MRRARPICATSHEPRGFHELWMEAASLRTGSAARRVPPAGSRTATLLTGSARRCRALTPPSWPVPIAAQRGLAPPRAGGTRGPEGSGSGMAATAVGRRCGAERERVHIAFPALTRPFQSPLASVPSPFPINSLHRLSP